MLGSRKIPLILGVTAFIIVVETVVFVYLALAAHPKKAIPVVLPQNLPHPEGASQMSLGVSAFSSDNHYLTFTGILRDISADTSHVYAVIDVFAGNANAVNTFAVSIDPGLGLVLNVQGSPALFPRSSEVTRQHLAFGSIVSRLQPYKGRIISVFMNVGVKAKKPDALMKSFESHYLPCNAQFAEMLQENRIRKLPCIPATDSVSVYETK